MGFKIIVQSPIDIEQVTKVAKLIDDAAEKCRDLSQWCWEVGNLDLAEQYRQCCLTYQGILEDYLFEKANKASDFARAAWLEWNATPSEWVEEYEAAVERMLLAEAVEEAIDRLIDQYC